MLELLDENARRVLFDIYDREFDAELPHSDQANILAVKNGDDIEAFVTAEVLIRADMWWVKEELRNTPKAAAHIRKMARYLLKTIPKGSSIITLAGCDTHRKIFEHLGMRYVAGDVYRIDL